MRLHNVASMSAILGLGTCLLTIVGIAHAQWSGQTADEIISFDDNRSARLVQPIFDDHLQRLHLIWREVATSGHEIHYGVSTDRGLTWSSTESDRVISFEDANDLNWKPAVAVGSEGELLVVWGESVNSAHEVHFGVSTDGGDTFSSETEDLTLSDVSTTAHAWRPEPTIDADGAMHVVWHQSIPQAADEIFYSRSTDQGATWSGSSGDRMISFPDGFDAAWPKIVAIGTRLIVTWQEEDDSGLPMLHVGLSDDAGLTWTSETADRPISPPANDMEADKHDLAAMDAWHNDPFVIAGYVAKYAATNPFHFEAYVTYSTDAGTTWTGETMAIPVSFDEGQQTRVWDVDVFYSPCADAVVAWREVDNATSSWEQHISIRNENGWSGATADNIVSFPDVFNGFRPAITGIRDPEASAAARTSGESVFDTWIVWSEFSGNPPTQDLHVSATQMCGEVSAVSSPVSEQAWLKASPNPAENFVRIEYQRDETSGLDALDIFTADGRKVRTIDTSTRSGEAVWNLRDESGERVSSGVYLARLSTASKQVSVPVVVR